MVQTHSLNCQCGGWAEPHYAVCGRINCSVAVIFETHVWIMPEARLFPTVVKKTNKTFRRVYGEKTKMSLRLS